MEEIKLKLSVICQLYQYSHVSLIINGIFSLQQQKITKMIPTAFLHDKTLCPFTSCKGLQRWVSSVSKLTSFQTKDHSFTSSRGRGLKTFGVCEHAPTPVHRHRLGYSGKRLCPSDRTLNGGHVCRESHQPKYMKKWRTHSLTRIGETWVQPHKAFFQWQITKISYKSADNQSEARISVAYYKTVICQWLQVLWNGALV